jgi:hypothetical protein
VQRFHYHGGEGDVYVVPERPDVALKIWKPARVGDFDASVNFLVAMRWIVETDPVISQHVRVVRILEKGPKWIVREFVKESIPLRDAIARSPEARSAFDALVTNYLIRHPQNEVLRYLKLKLLAKPISENLHWDPASLRIVIIDGF